MSGGITVPLRNLALTTLRRREFRSLFEEDYKAFELEEKINAAFEIEKRQEYAIAERAAALEHCRAAWSLTPNLQNTIELLSLAALHGKADVFSAAANEIINAFRNKGIEGLSASELAELLASHYRLLPAAERSSGVLFMFKRNVAELAAGEIDKSE